MPLTHSPLLQSHLELHGTPTLHAVLHPPPPQSTPVSRPSLIPLVHVAACRHLNVVVLQLLLRQSVLLMQVLAVPHMPHIPPPQFRSLSRPSLTCIVAASTDVYINRADAARSEQCGQ